MFYEIQLTFYSMILAKFKIYSRKWCYTVGVNNITYWYPLKRIRICAFLFIQNFNSKELLNWINCTEMQICLMIFLSDLQSEWFRFQLVAVAYPSTPHNWICMLKILIQYQYQIIINNHCVRNIDIGKLVVCLWMSCKHGMRFS